MCKLRTKSFITLAPGKKDFSATLTWNLFNSAAVTILKKNANIFFKLVSLQSAKCHSPQMTISKNEHSRKVTLHAQLGKSYWRGRKLITVDLLVLTGSDKLLLKLETLVVFITKQATLMRRLTVLSLVVRLLTDLPFTNSMIHWHRLFTDKRLGDNSLTKHYLCLLQNKLP